MQIELKCEKLEGFEWLGETVEIREPLWVEIEPILGGEISEMEMSRRMLELCLWIDGKRLGSEGIKKLGMSQVMKLVRIAPRIAELIGMAELDEKKD